MHVFTSCFAGQKCKARYLSLKVPMKTFSSMFYRFKQQMIVYCMPNYQNFKNTEHNKREPNHRVDLVLK